MLTVIGYFSMLFVGLSLGIMGSGGAILTVPILVYLFRIPPQTATGYSLGVVGIVSFIGFYRQFTIMKKNSHDLDGSYIHKAMIFALASILGTILARHMIVPQLPEVIFELGSNAFRKDHLLMTLFAIVMLLAAGSMIKPAAPMPSQSVEPASQLLKLQLIALGLAVGTVAGCVGAGGGFLIVPVLVMIARIPMDRAVGISLLIIGINSLMGFSVDLVQHTTYVPVEFLLTISAIALIGLWLGGKVAQKIPQAKLKTIFGWFVLAMGVFILGMQFLGA